MAQVKYFATSGSYQLNRGSIFNTNTGKDPGDSLNTLVLQGNHRFGSTGALPSKKLAISLLFKEKSEEQTLFFE